MTSTLPAAVPVGTAVDLDLVQRVILPAEHDPDILPLYVDADTWTSFPLYEDEGTLQQQRGFLQPDTDRAVVRLSERGVLGSLIEDRGFRVPHRRKVSFGTYFNAFPTSYWRRWTTLEGITLRVRTSGEGQILLYRSNARGVVQRVDSVSVSGDNTAEFELDFAFFTDGGWYWFDLAAEEQDFALEEAGWYAPAGSSPTRGRSGTTSVAITTLNRGEYCAKLLADIGSRPDVLALVDRVFVVDQGSEKIKDAAGFALAQERLGAKLRVIEQANIGGSGGFARGMFETLEAGESDNVLLLDDDIAIEPESIRRALKFGDYLTAPAIVGGHMFDMYDKSHLLAFAEGVERWNFMWGPITPPGHDFATSNLRQTRWLHRRVDADYNGWWMSMIPVEVLRETGLSLPVFIKWDDAEYSLRAAERGFPTVTLPGAAVWHISWVDKDDSQDWQAFYHARNRLVAALLHSPFPKGGGLTRANLALDLKHLLSMQYFAAAARAEAYRSVLAGPESLFAELGTRLPKVRELASRFPDGVPIRDKNALPVVRPGGPAPQSHKRNYPTRAETLPWLAKTLRRHYLQPASVKDETPPQVHLPFSDARWWVVPAYDSLLVTNAEGSGVLWHRRDRGLFRSGLWRSIRFRQRLRAEWPELSRRYRESLGDLTSVESWRRVFSGTE
ncbi:glycosyltransferase [Naasia aerilata]|uniref:Glycosyl transferase n=1 Tax=Naasia aerilata TaxID=1162966 RepID=A0ABM8GCE1_9MICO|nr:glycosyltransferase [Naasia aerilata]BDZ45913.1 glycosyl transferase [Naasia aerilata]